MSKKPIDEQADAVLKLVADKPAKSSKTPVKSKPQTSRAAANSSADKTPSMKTATVKKVATAKTSSTASTPKPSVKKTKPVEPKSTKSSPAKKVKKKVTARKNIAKPKAVQRTAANSIASKKETPMQTPNFTQPFDFSAFSQQSANASREHVEAFIKSSTIFAKGMEDLIQTATKLVQASAEKQAQLTKELMASKTLNEMAETQNKIAQANFNTFVANSTKLSEMSAKLLSDASEPINKQMSKTMSAAQKKAA